MNTIFMNSENIKTSERHTLKLKLTDKLDLRLDKKVIALSNASMYYTWNNIKSSYNNNKFKISTPTWNEEFTLPDGSYSVSDIQDFFQYILKKHGENTDKPLIQIKNGITFKVKKGYSLELLTKETMKLLGSAKNKITKDKNGENVPHPEIAEVVLVHCNMVKNDYQHDSRVLYTLDISPSSHIFLITFNSEYDETVVWFTGQNSKPLEIEDRINLTMVIK